MAPEVGAQAFPNLSRDHDAPLSTEPHLHRAAQLHVDTSDTFLTTDLGTVGFWFSRSRAHPEVLQLPPVPRVT